MMNRRTWLGWAAGVPLIRFGTRQQPDAWPSEGMGDSDGRLAWWEAARFGMFIHWGLYSILGGEWGDRTDYGEWIRNNAHIPIGEYDQLLARFNPIAFDADRWMTMAKDAGMKYIVITTKHHDGFALFDSRVSDFDVMATPFRRDIMREISRAARRHGLRLGWYHSIMDWHHPDYLPRREWEVADRPAEGADFDRYVRYLHAQVTELLTHYGPVDIMWFDGQWENTWNHQRGQALYQLCRRLQPDMLINNRVDQPAADGNSTGLPADRVGDFGTPEQEVPPNGLPGVAWESCITMNRNWGYNSHDHDFKTPREIVKLLIDTASRGGNLLLNVGPTGEGRIPEDSIARLREVGDWMRANGEAIYGTTASVLPPGLPPATTGVRRINLFLTEPRGPTLVIPGLRSSPIGVVLSAGASKLAVGAERTDEGLRLTLPESPVDPICPVVTLTFAEPPVVG
jgi:alpha-L-fucosidase